MTLHPDHADALSACVSSVLAGEALDSKSANSILPPELLARCFEFLGFNDRILVSGISRHWRHVALGTPTLWASFSVLPERENERIKLNELVRRSQAVQMSVTIRGAHHFDALLRERLPSTRLRSLDIYYMPEILDLPVLERLTVSSRARLAMRILGRSARSLRVLRLLEFIVEGSCPVLRNLREFEGTFGPDTNLARVLALCPRLESLAIVCDHALGADPRPLFVHLPASLTDVSISGMFYPELDPFGVWTGHRFRVLDVGCLRDISSALRLFDSALDASASEWAMEVLVDDTISYVLHAASAETRIAGPGSVYSLAVEAIANLQSAQHHLARLTSFTVPLRYFGLCVETGIELPALEDLVLTVHPNRDHKPELPGTDCSTAMTVPRLRSFAFLCRPPLAFSEDAVHLFLLSFPKRLREWLCYDAERLQRIALEGEVPSRILGELGHGDPMLRSLATEVDFGWTACGPQLLSKAP